MTALHQRIYTAARKQITRASVHWQLAAQAKNDKVYGDLMMRGSSPYYLLCHCTPCSHTSSHAVMTGPKATGADAGRWNVTTYQQYRDATRQQRTTAA